MQTMATENTEFIENGNILTLLFTRGLNRTLEHLCNITVFSVLSMA